MLAIRGFSKIRRGDGYLFEAHPIYHGCTFVLYGRDGSALKNNCKIPLALVSLQSKKICDHYEPVQGKIEQTGNEYIYVFDEEQADLEIVYANLLPKGSGDMKFKFRLEPEHADRLLNKITVLHAGQNYTMTCSAFGSNPHEFNAIRIQTKDSLLRKMGVTTKENLTNVEKYKGIKQQLVFDIIPSKSTSKYFACGIELKLQDNYFIKVSNCNNEYRDFDMISYDGGITDDEVDGMAYECDGPCTKDCLPRNQQHLAEITAGKKMEKDCLSRIPENQQHLAEITAGKRMERPLSIAVTFDPDDEFALFNICITLTGTDKRRSW